MNVAVVIPIYKSKRSELKWFETISLKRCVEVLGHYPIVFVAPSDRDFDYLPSEVDYRVENFDPNFFEGRDGYNRLMLEPNFYDRFRAFDYILICQSDAFVFSDRLEEFCWLGYDYIGAPWSLASGIKKAPFLYVGNGGFSLRRVRSCFDVLSNNRELIESLRMPEDATFSYLGKLEPSKFRVAPIRTASQFSVEHLPERWCRRNENVLPFGCHGWYALSSEFYVKTFSEFGIDLEPFAHLMGNCDRINLERYLRQALARRLINRLKNDRPLRKYLPSNEKFFVMLADKRSEVLARKLFFEGLPIVNPNGIPILINDERIRQAADELKQSAHRGLLLSLTDDSRTIEQLKLVDGGGAEYGRNFLSFWREYMKSSVALLRKISRPSVKRLTRSRLLR